MIHKLIFEQEPRVPKKVQCLRRVLGGAAAAHLLLLWCLRTHKHTHPAGERTRGHRRVVADMRASCWRDKGHGYRLKLGQVLCFVLRTDLGFSNRPTCTRHC